MGPDLIALFQADAAEAIAARRDDNRLATARQRDGAAYDMRALGAAIGGSLIQSDDPGQFGTLNAAVRVPTTLDHPNAVVAK